MRNGTIIILNGASSSGKTSILNELQEILTEPYLDAGIDKFFWMLPKRYLDRPLWDEVLGLATQAGLLGHQLASGMNHTLVALSKTGLNLIADHVLVEPGWIRECATFLCELPAFLIGIRCPLDVLEKCEKDRRDLTFGQARAQFEVVHGYGIYDLEVDTSILSPEDCALKIKTHIENGIPPNAFKRLKQQEKRKLIMENPQTRFDAIAKTVLAYYPLDEPHLTFIRHSDNATYKIITANSEKYLLRIHVPITSAMGAHGADYDMVNSEMMWLQALARETKLTLQKPILSRSGGLVTRFSQEGSTPVNCTLLSWVNGKPYNRDLESEQTVYQIGMILATLHNQVSQWSCPEGFKRPKRDIRYFTNVLEGLMPAVEDGRINRSDYAELSQSIDLLIDRMSSLDESQQFYGIMHADAHKGNMLYHEGKIRLIDFSFCAFGNYMFDLGICLSDMKEEFRLLCLEGYQSLRELPDNYQQWIEGFFIGSMVGTFSYLVHNPRAQEILARKVPQIAQDYARKLNQGVPFWFSA